MDTITETTETPNTTETTEAVSNIDEHEAILKIRRRQLEEIKGVEADRQVLTRGQMEKKYEGFAAKYPRTWVSIMDGNFNIHHLERNIEVYESMFRRSRGNYNQRKFKTDKQFGEILAEKYLYPTTGKPSKKKMEQAEKKVLASMKRNEEGKFDVSNLRKVDFD